MRTHVKKKRYADHVRSQVLAGLLNDEKGNWVHNNPYVSEKGKQHSLCGVMGKGSRSR